MMGSQSADRKLLGEYAEGHMRCAICHYRKYRPGRHMELHHIVGRYGKAKHDHRNLIMLCNTCHWAVHNRVPPPFDGLSNCHVLAAKQEEDPDLFDPEFLASLRRKKHLGYDPEPIPDAYLEERVHNEER